MFVLFEDSDQLIPSEQKMIALGSLWICEEELTSLECEIFKLRVKVNCWGEFKYNHLDRLHIDHYKEILTLFLNSNAKLNLIIQKEPTSHELKTFHGGDPETARMKMMFNLLFYNYSKYKAGFCSDNELYLIADEPFLRVGTHKDNFLKQLDSPTHFPVKHATKCNSKILGAMQVVDLLTGLICAHTANFYYPAKYIPKPEAVELIEILKRSCNIDPITSGRPNATVKVNNWFHRPGITWRSV